MEQFAGRYKNSKNPKSFKNNYRKKNKYKRYAAAGDIF